MKYEGCKQETFMISNFAEFFFTCTQCLFYGEIWEPIKSQQRKILLVPNRIFRIVGCETSNHLHWGTPLHKTYATEMTTFVVSFVYILKVSCLFTLTVVWNVQNKWQIKGCLHPSAKTFLSIRVHSISSSSRTKSFFSAFTA